LSIQKAVRGAEFLVAAPTIYAALTTAANTQPEAADDNI
jgi:hypothetical protein